LSPTTRRWSSRRSLSGLVTFDDVVSNREAWKALMLMATLVTLAGGLSGTGFVRWFAEGAAGGMAGMPPLLIVILLTTTYFFTHYLFASITAHVTAMMPIMLSVGANIPGLPLTQFALLLALTHGFMGVLTPYATTSGPVYLGSGYITSAEFWRLGAIFGAIFLVALLSLSAPVLFWMRWI
jgi:L-tartrate/succinate antiporter